MESAPEDAVVQDQEVRPGGNGVINGLLRAIDAECHLGYAAVVLHLQAIHGHGRVFDVADAQGGVQQGYDVGKRGTHKTYSALPG